MNDGYSIIKLEFNFTFLDTVYTDLSISPNGFVCLGINDECDQDIRPAPFDVLVILNYDLNTARGDSGQIYYKTLSLDSNEFRSTKIYTNLLDPSFVPTNTFVITYDEVLPNDKSLNSRFSFQVYLSTDSIKSYVLYKYKACPSDLALKASSGLTHNNTGTLKEVIIDHGQQCTSSNVGQTGVWVIEVTNSASGKNSILSKQNLN
jgi:hypothetical protein